MKRFLFLVLVFIPGTSFAQSCYSQAYSSELPPTATIGPSVIFELEAIPDIPSKATPQLPSKATPQVATPIYSAPIVRYSAPVFSSQIYSAAPSVYSAPRFSRFKQKFKMRGRVCGPNGCF